MIKIKASDLIINSKRWGKIPKMTHGETVGWVVKWQGKEYGDYVTIVDLLSKQILQETAEIFTDQANDTMILVIGEQFIKDTGLDWKAFAMTHMSLKDGLAIKIQTKEEAEASLEKYLEK